MTQEQFFPKQSSLDHIKLTVGFNSHSVHWSDHKQRVLTSEFPKRQRRIKICVCVFFFKCELLRVEVGFFCCLHKAGILAEDPGRGGANYVRELPGRRKMRTGLAQ